VGECFFWYWLTQLVADKGPKKIAVLCDIQHLFNSYISRWSWL